MQDRYAGDLGDFLTFGLLRHLVAPHRDEPAMQLGVVWYLTRDEWHNADGKHVAYLDPTHREAARFRDFDDALYDGLRAVVESGRRSVGELERSGVLPQGTRTHRRLLDLADLPSTDRVGRLARRRAWLSQALAATAGCQLVFLDPDNGLRPSEHHQGRHLNRSVKHAYLDELTAFASRGQSVVAYHHADRTATVAEQARRRLAEVAREVGVEPLAAVLASGGTARFFAVVPTAGHVDRLSERLNALALGPWTRALRVQWWHGDDGRARRS